MARYLELKCQFNDKPKKERIISSHHAPLGWTSSLGLREQEGVKSSITGLPHAVHSFSFNYPPLEFYAKVEQELAAHKIPGMEISRVQFAEGGLLSDQRTYLRLMRERLCIDTCAAPFGNIFFFSFRTVYVPALVRLWHIMAAIAFFIVVERLLIIPSGNFIRHHRRNRTGVRHRRRVA